MKTTKLLYRTPGVLALLILVLVVLTDADTAGFLDIVLGFFLLWGILGIYLKYRKGVEV
mgnify:CR=1 FL=1